MRSGRNRVHVGVDRQHQLLNRCQALACIADKFHTLGDSSGRVGDESLDFLCRIRGTLGQLSNFLCNNRKALPGLTGSRRFDACIQGKQVGLECDLVNNADDLVDLTRGLLDTLHRCHGIAHHAS